RDTSYVTRWTVASVQSVTLSGISQEQRARMPLQSCASYAVMKDITWINLLSGIWLLCAGFAVGCASTAHAPIANQCRSRRSFALRRVPRRDDRRASRAARINLALSIVQSRTSQAGVGHKSHERTNWN